MTDVSDASYGILINFSVRLFLVCTSHSWLLCVGLGMRLLFSPVPRLLCVGLGMRLLFSPVPRLLCVGLGTRLLFSPVPRLLCVGMRAW